MVTTVNGDESIHIDPMMLSVLQQYVANARHRGRPSIARLEMSSKKRKRREVSTHTGSVAQLGEMDIANFKRLKLS